MSNFLNKIANVTRKSPASGRGRQSGPPSKLSSGDLAKVLALVVQYLAVKTSPGGDGENSGKTTGVNLTHFTNALFLCIADGTPLGEGQISQVIRAEFPNRGKIQKPTNYRSYIKNGEHGQGLWSGQYDSKGKPVYLPADKHPLGANSIARTGD